MKRLLLALLASVALDAAACGVCIDDKIASCYDHALIARERARGNQVAFFAIQGSLPQDEATRAMLRRTLDSTPGVLRGSARFSVENAALSFAYDPRRGSALGIGQKVERRLSPGLALALLRVI